MRTVAAAVLASLVISSLVAPGPVMADAPAVVLPQDGDEYSKLVARADAQDATLDFRALRLAWLKSAARKRVGDEDALRRAVFDAADGKDAARVRDAAVKLLSADYIDMYGQKFLRQSCKLLGDTACEQKARFVEFGLLESIVRSGDGKTCETGWEAFTVKEEYFVIAMRGAQFHTQALVGGCDRLDVTDENGQAASYFFRIAVMMEDEAAGLR